MVMVSPSDFRSGMRHAIWGRSREAFHSVTPQRSLGLGETTRLETATRRNMRSASRKSVMISGVT